MVWIKVIYRENFVCTEQRFSMFFDVVDFILKQQVEVVVLAEAD